MNKRDDFSKITVNTLAQRAGQRCSNPNCGKSTTGPSDVYSDKSTISGKAAHITAASPNGPRYDSNLTSEERKSANNGIWMCSECADRIDKTENESEYPVELLKHWKIFHESSTGTDFNSIENRIKYPIRELTVKEYAGVRIESTISFGSITVMHGTNYLNKNICELLQIFSDRNSFENVKLKNNSKLCLTLSDVKKYIICFKSDKTNISIDDTIIPVFSPVINIFSYGDNFKETIYYSKNKNVIENLSEYFNISVEELHDCIRGVPSDDSIFGCDYNIIDNSEIKIKFNDNDYYQSILSLSSGELTMISLDIIVRISKYISKIKPVILAINQYQIRSLCNVNIIRLLEWFNNRKLPFQLLVELNIHPSGGNIKNILCYDTIGSDMNVNSFKLIPCNDFFKYTMVNETTLHH